MAVVRKGLAMALAAGIVAFGSGPAGTLLAAPAEKDGNFRGVWPRNAQTGRFVVRYSIDTSTLGPTAIAECKQAVKRWGQVAPIDFKACEDGEPCVWYSAKTDDDPVDSAAFTYPKDWGFKIAFRDPDDARAALHETGHALGLKHEAQRQDRNRYVTYHPVCSDRQESFTRSTDPYTNSLAPYDIDSIMQYESFIHSWPGSQKKDCVAGEDPETGQPIWTQCCPALLRRSSIEDAGPLWGVQNFPPAVFYGRYIPFKPDVSPEDINTIHQMYEPRLGHNNDDDTLGAAMVAADFDDDGYDDLAVGAPGNGDGSSRAGAVYLYKGTKNGLVAWKVLRERDAGGAWAAGDDDFGAALAAVKIRGSRYAGLIVGAPGNDRTDPDGGAIFVYLGHADGPRPDDAKAYDQASLGIGSVDNGDRFGASLAIGHFTANGDRDFVVVGSPGEGPGGSSVHSGMVSFFEIVAGGDVRPPVNLVPGGTPSEGDLFGAALVVADLTGDGIQDLAVGMPQDEVPEGAGRVLVFAGGAGDLALLETLDDRAPETGARFGWSLAAGRFNDERHPGTNRRITALVVGAPGRASGRGRISVFAPGAEGDASSRIRFRGSFTQADVEQTNREGDGFGSALAAADFTEDGLDDLAVGVPRKDLGGVDDTGMVALFTGTATPGVFLRGYGNAYAHPAGDVGPARNGDRFGSTLAVGDFDPDRLDADHDLDRVNLAVDLAIGEPGRSVGGHPRAGAFHAYRGGTTFPNFKRSFHQATSDPN